MPPGSRVALPLKSPYLTASRLADVIAAIQTMSLYDKYKVSCAEWSHRISGDRSRAEHWKAVFVEHPEFFRRSSSRDDHFSLVWRRVAASISSTRTRRDYRSRVPSSA